MVESYVRDLTAALGKQLSLKTEKDVSLDLDGGVYIDLEGGASKQCFKVVLCWYNIDLEALQHGSNGVNIGWRMKTSKGRFFEVNAADGQVWGMEFIHGNKEDLNEQIKDTNMGKFIMGRCSDLDECFSSSRLKSTHMEKP
ncbi:hypothetical protein SLEP1_g23578 [Rubroshorea leprosula]|uniref:Uncharacterized protein n=1 Tax=Rubroshorea leprosula TaxID=152421 RepID=A0AAV5JD06_9ROSI|nr:hypothetical protein SLEP1_g23578 [Rubroshorea leprosula]